MDWCRDTVLLFINLIRERPVIWDTQIHDYRIKQKRQDAVEEIALLMGVSVKTVNAKWTSLKNQYSREKRNMTGMRTGSGADAIYTTKWYAFKEMESLMDGNTPEHTYNNLSESSSSPPTPRPPSTLTPPMRPPSTPTPPMRPPSTPTPPMRPPSTPSPHQPSTSSSELQQYPTPIPPTSSKRKKIDVNSIHREAIETIKSIRQDRATRKNEPSSPNTDDLSSFGLYVAAQIRKFNPRLQCKAKMEINNILYVLETQSLDDITQQTAQKVVLAKEKYNLRDRAISEQLNSDEETENAVHLQPQQTAQKVMILPNDDHNYLRGPEIDQVFSYEGTQNITTNLESEQSTSWVGAEYDYLSESELAVSHLLKFNNKQ